ncbi:SgcJ/EcaC family oxidoreductase [Aquisediminimonas sediminicola]|uniref:SgcJ/EcaC family oxidoreductase n=1 Tax=Alteraquisediminimonas sediminicola TaxID=2676787 RepID=UPI001C8EE9B2
MLNQDAQARVGIDALIATYSDAVNRRDADAWAACWAEDAIWRFHGHELVGRDAILAAWRKAMASYEHVWFMAFVGHIELHGNNANLRTHTFEYLHPASSSPKLQSGLYDDSVTFLDGRWIFTIRSFSSQELPL